LLRNFASSGTLVLWAETMYRPEADSFSATNTCARQISSTWVIDIEPDRNCIPFRAFMRKSLPAKYKKNGIETFETCIRYDHRRTYAYLNLLWEMWLGQHLMGCLEWEKDQLWELVSQWWDQCDSLQQISMQLSLPVLWRQDNPT